MLALLAIWLAWRAPALLEDYVRLTAQPADAVPVIASAPATMPPPILAAAPPDLREIRTKAVPEYPRNLAVARPEAIASSSSAEPKPEGIRAESLEIAQPAALLATMTPEPAAIAYRALAAGDRRAASAAFRRALAETPGDPRATAWRAQLAAIEKRWSASAYSFVRSSGSSGLAATPVLGGGQSGAQIAYSIDPLAKRPVEVVARLTAPNAGLHDGAQGAVGVSWRLHPALSLTAERLIALGDGAPSGWTLRAAGGAATRPDGRRSWLDASLYGEAGAVGLRDTATYGAVQGRIGRAVLLQRNVTIAGAAGLWTSVQHDRRTVSRIEIGPTLRARLGSLEIAADYRFRVAGNAAPGSGPALTLAAYF